MTRPEIGDTNSEETEFTTQQGIGGMNCEATVSTIRQETGWLRNIKLPLAVTYQSEAMEPETILKNGASLKSQMSKRNFFK